MIATGIISFFIFVSLTAATIVTFVARKMFFPETLNQDMTLLLALIFSVIAGLIFTFIYPLDFSGKRKDGL